MLWACLHFSDLPLRAVFDDSEQTLPCGVVDGPLQRQHIVFVNAPASRGGVRAGRVLAAARAVCAALQARRRDRAGEQRLLLSLAAWAYRFSSHVSLSGSDALLIEVGASLRLFGGWGAGTAAAPRTRRHRLRPCPRRRARACRGTRARHAARRFLHRPARTDAGRARQRCARACGTGRKRYFTFIQCRQPHVARRVCASAT